MTVSLKVNTIQTSTGGNMFTGGAGSIVRVQPVIVKDMIRKGTLDTEYYVFMWDFDKLNSAANSKVVAHAVRLGRDPNSGVQGEYIKCVSDGVKNHNIDGTYQSASYGNVVNGLFEWTTLAAGSHRFEFAYRSRTSNQIPINLYQPNAGVGDGRGANMASSIILYEVLV